MVFLTLTDGYNRIARLFGRKTSYLGTKDSFTSEKIMEGQFVVDRYKKDNYKDFDHRKLQKTNTENLSHSIHHLDKLTDADNDSNNSLRHSLNRSNAEDDSSFGEKSYH